MPIDPPPRSSSMIIMIIMISMISMSGETTTMREMSFLLPSLMDPRTSRVVGTASCGETCGPAVRRSGGRFSAIETFRLQRFMVWLAGILKFVAISTCLIATQASGQSSITIDRFGAGNAFRPGGSVAVRVRIQSDLDEPVPGLLQWETINGDGDIVANTREIAVPARGGAAVTWVVAELPSDSAASDLFDRIWTFRLFEFRDGARAEEIAVARIDAAIAQARPVEQYQGMAMVIGRNAAGLSGFDQLRGFPIHEGLNEETIIVTNVEPGDLPDHAAGLSTYELIVWAANDQNFLPSAIDNKPSIEAALREWMERGGHLVILLPGTSDPWRLGRNESVFGDLLAGLVAIPDEGTPLRTLLPALSDRTELRQPDRLQPIHRFDPATLPNAWRPLDAVLPPTAEQTDALKGTAAEIVERRLDATTDPMTAADPIVYAVRRDVGHGLLDVVGIDVADPDLQLQQAGGLPKTWVFWNAILGRRAFTPTASALETLAKEKTLARRPPIDSLGSGELISDRIGLSSGATFSVLGGFLLFLTYWAVAGPLGFAILARLKRKRLAWVTFAMTSIAFAIIAWFSGRIVGSDGVQMRHVTILRHLYRPEGTSNDVPQFDLVRTWFSARLPGYGKVDVRLEGDVEGNQLDQFSPPPNGLSQQFPNTDRYEISIDERDGYEVPARATSAEFTASWLGRIVAVEDAWKSTIKVKVDDPIRLTRDAAGQMTLNGTLINGTGLDLNDVRIAVVFPLRTPMSPTAANAIADLPLVLDEPPNYGGFVALSGPFVKGQELDLRTILVSNGRLPSERLRGPTSLPTAIRDSFKDPNAGAFVDQLYNAGQGASITSESDRRKFLTMLSIFQMLPPPVLEVMPGSSASGNVKFNRWLARECDVSDRFGEPGVFLFGTAENAPCPVPISIDGERTPGDGMVFLQWIHPLPPVLEGLARPAYRTDSNNRASTSSTISGESQSKNGVASAWP